jgi:hypothetical protein
MSITNLSSDTNETEVKICEGTTRDPGSNLRCLYDELNKIQSQNQKDPDRIQKILKNILEVLTSQSKVQNSTPFTCEENKIGSTWRIPDGQFNSLISQLKTVATDNKFNLDQDNAIKKYILERSKCKYNNGLKRTISSGYKNFNYWRNNGGKKTRKGQVRRRKTRKGRNKKRKTNKRQTK